MVKGKEKFALWLTPEAKGEVERHFKEDNCQSKSEFIEKAIRFYSGYLDADRSDDYLPRVLAQILESKLSALGDRMGRLLFKLAVEQDMSSNLLAAAWEFDPDAVRRLRGQCVRAVKETNGIITMEETVRDQQGAE